MFTVELANTRKNIAFVVNYQICAWWIFWGQIFAFPETSNPLPPWVFDSLNLKLSKERLMDLPWEVSSLNFNTQRSQLDGSLNHLASGVSRTKGLHFVKNTSQLQSSSHLSNSNCGDLAPASKTWLSKQISEEEAESSLKTKWLNHPSVPIIDNQQWVSLSAGSKQLLMFGRCWLISAEIVFHTFPKTEQVSHIMLQPLYQNVCVWGEN